ncbi:bladder cancer-associated protein isoform X1 [Choloepus didactylus]|uniref:bladder cancer-associated protein isoform X1 n=1 Tax=Choloepus didactylus TaxID=27675 RepID=UPI00189E84C5|nr:bladder cancer-associated protein isoform X1 [Choloepus didactylus]
MGGPQCCRAAMLSLWGHLRHHLVSHPSEGSSGDPGATPALQQGVAHFVLSLGLGCPFSARGRVTELLGFQSQCMSVCSRYPVLVCFSQRGFYSSFYPLRWASRASSGVLLPPPEGCGYRSSASPARIPAALVIPG